MKIKWGNIFLLLLFMALCLDLIYVFFKLCFSLATLTLFGLITTILSLMAVNVIGKYLYNEMNK